MRIEGKRIIAFTIEKDRERYVLHLADTENKTDGVCKKAEIAVEPANIRRIANLVSNDKYAYVGFGNKYRDNIMLNYILLNQSALESMGTKNVTEFIDNNLERTLSGEDSELERKYKYATLFNSFDLQRFMFSKDQMVTLEEFVVSSDFEHTGKEHDVDNIVNILELNKERIAARLEIENIYGEDLFDAHEGIVGNKLIKSLYAKKNGIKRSEIRNVSDGPKSVRIGDILLPCISFETEWLKMFLDDLKNETIDIGDNWTKYVAVGRYGAFMNLAGLRMNTEPCMLKSDCDGDIYNIDVASFYPTILSVYSIRPRQVNGTFNDIFDDMLAQRLRFKYNSNEECSKAMKFMLNGIVGQFMIEGSWLYDPAASLKIRINGALMMLMLMESLLDIADIKCVTIDGMVVKTKDFDKMKETLERWSVKTGLHADTKKYEYSYMLSNNDYVSDSTSKGFFSYSMNNGHASVPNIIRKAVIDHIVNNVPISDTVTNGDNICDYLSSITSNDTLEWYGTMFNNARFYYSDGQKLCKVKENYSGEPTLVPVTDNGVTVVEDIGNKMPDDINFQYYMTEAGKIVEKMKFTQLNLF